MTAKGYFVTCEVGDCICELISRKLSDDEFEHLTYQDIADRLNKLTKENEQLASELIECKALIMMLSDTTVSGRVDNLIYSRYNFYSEDEYYKKLEEYKNKVIKEL